MEFDFDDFYNEPCFDERFEEIKNNLRQTVKKEILDEVEKLKKENEELKVIKNNFDDEVNKVRREYNRKAWELECKYQEDLEKVKKAPLNELIELCSKTYYDFSKNFDYVPKCDKCNEDRKIVFIDPYNRKHSFDCVCNKIELKGLKIDEHRIDGISEVNFKNGELSMFCSFNWKTCGEDTPAYYLNGNYFNKDLVLSKFEERSFLKFLKDKRTNVWGIYFDNLEEAEKCKVYLEAHPELWNN